MTVLEEAVSRYHKLLDTPAYRDLAWVKSIQEKMVAHNLVPSGRPVCPVLRPHFVSRRQLTAMAKAAEALYTAMDRMRQLAVSSPVLLNRMDMLPGERMLATLDPGYPHLAVTSMLDTQLHNGTFQFLQAQGDCPAGAVYNETLSDIFFDAGPVRELRKKLKLSKTHGMKRLLHSLLAAYKVSGKKKFPCIAIVEFRPPFKNTPSQESELLAEYFRRSGYPTESVTPEQLEYRGGALVRGDFAIDLVYRKVSAQEFLVRFDLMHPLVRAYREGAACVVNSFRTELVRKKAMFSLLTDETLTARFPLNERKAIQDHLPWTRSVVAAKTTYKGKPVDLPEFILQNRKTLVLHPNDPASGLSSYYGREVEDSAWERAVRTAMRGSYVVQEQVEAVKDMFPVLQGGGLVMREMEIEVHPHVYLGKVESCSTEVKDATSSFSTLAGMAPTFIVESGN
jgi:uncharacterized circularly permuted ATP-grasp superfamily protein